MAGGWREPLELQGNPFEDILDETQFVSFIERHAASVLSRVRFFPLVSRLRLVEAHAAWCDDLKRVQDHEPELANGLDHFKRAGHLAYWLRRFMPVVDVRDTTKDLADSEQYPVLAREQDFRDFLFVYLNEYLAFDIGLMLCRYYEQEEFPSSRRAFEFKPDMDYWRTVCHMLKRKNVSPHGIALIYKSLFAT